MIGVGAPASTPKDNYFRFLSLSVFSDQFRENEKESTLFPRPYRVVGRIVVYMCLELD